MFIMHEYDDGSIEWQRGNRIPYWRRASGLWVIKYQVYDFDEWLRLTEFSEEEKLMLKLRFG